VALPGIVSSEEFSFLMHEDLLGYLLGALEPHEMDRVRRALEDDPQLQAELERWREMMRPLEEGFSDPAVSGAAGLGQPAADRLLFGLYHRQYPAHHARQRHGLFL
jgi:anti-sigma-K factor RskA